MRGRRPGRLPGAAVSTHLAQQQSREVVSLPTPRSHSQERTARRGWRRLLHLCEGWFRFLWAGPAGRENVCIRSPYMHL